MTANPRNETRPATVPVPVRFSTQTLEEVERVARQYDISRQVAIRIATNAGLECMRRLGPDGMAKLMADLYPGR